MWTVVYMAQSLEVAEKIQNELLKNGIMIKMNPININSENKNSCFELVVPTEQVEQAHSIIVLLEL
jgi:hypothetical protein